MSLDTGFLMDFSSPIWTITIIFIVFAVILIAMLMAFYTLPSKNKTYVRTGLGGEHVLIDSGAFVLPVVHEAIPINMKTQRVEIIRKHNHALITKDRLRVDVKAEFHIRVKADKPMISVAARTLGSKTMSSDELKEQIEGFCVGSLRSVAAEMKMVELHEKRQEFSFKVEKSVSKVLEDMGLELVSVALTSMDQTELEYFPADNALNAAGITYIQEQLAENEMKQNALDQKKDVDIKQKKYEATLKKIEIDKNEQAASLARDREVRFAELDQKKQIKERELKIEQEIEKVEVEKEVTIMEYERKESVIRAQIERIIAETRMETDKIKAQAATAAEKVETAKEKEIAERNKLVEVISANKEADRQRIIATGTADAERIEADAAKIRYAIEAEGKKALNEAANLLSNDQVSLQVKQQIVNQLPSIIRESVRPIENIEGIKIVHVDGLTGGSRGNNGSGNGGGGKPESLADQVVDSALRYKAQAPLVESLLKEVGLEGGNIKELTKNLHDDLGTNTTSPDSDSSPTQE
jgi:uncharacterized membrane protein YqiK